MQFYPVRIAAVGAGSGQAVAGHEFADVYPIVCGGDVALLDLVFAAL